MTNLINFITSGSDTFTPASVVGVVVFVIIFDGLCGLISSVVKAVKV